MLSNKVNFGELVRLEPRLLELLNEAATIHVQSDKGQTIFYKDFKHRLIHLVGWLAEKDDKLLHTGKAYDCVYETIYSVLVK